MIVKKKSGSLLRILLRLSGGLLFLPVVIYLILLLGNLGDDDLLPEVDRLMNEQPHQISANDNGYFAWIGIMGPADQPVHAWGYRWFQEVTQQERNLQILESFGDLPIQAEVRREPIEESESPCKEIQSCLEKVAAAPELTRALLVRHRTTLERADQVLAFPTFQEAWRPDYVLSSPFPPYSTEWHRLAAARFALAVADGRHDDALGMLEKEISFHIRYLEGSYSLVNKMLGMRHLGSCYQLLNQYMRREPEAARKHLVQISSLLMAPPKASVDLRTAILNEQRQDTRLCLTLKSIFRTSNSPTSKLHARLWNRFVLTLMLPQTSANELAGLFSPWIHAEEGTGRDYRQALAQTARSTTGARRGNFLRWRNPVGHILNIVALPDYSRFFLRRDNLLALRSLVAFQAALLQQVTENVSEVSSMVEAAGSDLEHPYFGTHAVWDKARRRLLFPVTRGKLSTGDTQPVAIQL